MHKILPDMQHSNWFFWLWNQLDHHSLAWCGGTVILATVTQITANEVTVFFTVLVGTTTAILNIVKTRIARNKERDRKKREAQGIFEDDKDDD